MKKIAISMVLTLMFAEGTALAADPVTAGTANIGTVPGYSSAYAGFWKTGAPDYSLLTDGTNTFLNTPDSQGRFYFRFRNANTAIELLPWNMSVEVSTNFNRIVYMNKGMQVAKPSDGGWAAYILGGDYGVAGIGKIYGIYSDGPIYGSKTLTLAGEAYKPGGGAFAATSDVRVKKDIADFKLGLEAIELLRPIRFRYNGLADTADTGEEYVGVIAQELEKVAPFMVTSVKKKLHKEDKQATNVKHVDPSALTYMLVNSVQELAKQNREMRKVICRDHPGEALCTASTASALGSTDRTPTALR
jgi:hypothetical protein